MIVHLDFDGKSYKTDLRIPLDISIPLGQVKCFNAPDLKVEPLRSGSFIGEVNYGAAVNFYNIQINPHGNGTHTECLGHITAEHESIDNQLKDFHFISKLISLVPEVLGDDHVITKRILEDCFTQKLPSTLIIRTLDNSKSKLHRDYSNTNPPYFSVEAIDLLVDLGIEHLLVDLPSIDKEHDNGKLLGHKAYWQTESQSPRVNCTITELIYVADQVVDGLYLLNLQFPPLLSDAAPSRPVLFKMNLE